MRRPTAKTRCVAQRYAAPNERIIEISSPYGGCLIALRTSDADKRLGIAIYSADATVDVTVGEKAVYRG